MMQIDCPFCGRRDETEFSYGGEAHLTRPFLDVNDEWWVEYLFFRNNVKGVHAERWRHTRGCGQWFNAVRNTATHEFLAFYRATESRPATVSEVKPGIATGPGAATSVIPPSGTGAAAPVTLTSGVSAASSSTPVATGSR